VGLDLEHPDFFRPLAWTGVQPCGARRAERLGRSEGQTPRMDGRSSARADFLTTPFFGRRISRQERLGATISNSLDP